MKKIKIRKSNFGDLPQLIDLWRGQYEYHDDLNSTYYVSVHKNGHCI